ncbi:MAG: flavocytochrome c, partial [Burkholderiaceae bacterium]
APEKWDEETDIVIIGAGGAGLTAAVHAVDKKLGVIVLEKLPLVGGSSIICGGGFAVAGTDIQKALKIEDSKDLFFKDIMSVGENRNNPAVVRAYVDNALPTYQWMVDHGVVMDKTKLNANGSARRSVDVDPTSAITVLRDYATKRGAKILMRTPAERLAFDNASGRITGVFAKVKGKTVAIRARKGVLIASGGFARNKEMLGQYVPRMENSISICGLGSNGDGLKMAQAYGADVADMPYIKGTFGFTTKPSTIADMNLVFFDGGIIVNQKGQRFVNESISKKTIGDHALDQAGGVTYQIWDESIRQYALNGGFFIKRYEDRVKDSLIVGNTIAEVASKAGLDPAAVEATIKEYNGYVDGGKDLRFGRTTKTLDFGKIVKIEKAPFYIMPSRTVLLSTYCGIKINEKTEVIDVFGKVIPGLYAAGEVSGGFHGASYLGSTAFGKALVFGYVAAQVMANS